MKNVKNITFFAMITCISLFHTLARSQNINPKGLNILLTRYNESEPSQYLARTMNLIGIPQSLINDYTKAILSPTTTSLSMSKEILHDRHATLAQKSVAAAAMVDEFLGAPAIFDARLRDYSMILAAPVLGSFPQININDLPTTVIQYIREKKIPNSQKDTVRKYLIYAANLDKTPPGNMRFATVPLLYLYTNDIFDKELILETLQSKNLRNNTYEMLSWAIDDELSSFGLELLRNLAVAEDVDYKELNDSMILLQRQLETNPAYAEFAYQLASETPGNYFTREPIDIYSAVLFIFSPHFAIEQKGNSHWLTMGRIDVPDMVSRWENLFDSKVNGKDAR